jgi:hypothetical protein
MVAAEAQTPPEESADSSSSIVVRGYNILSIAGVWPYGSS